MTPRFRRSLPRTRSAFVLQLTHIHLTLQGCGVQTINHLWTCAGIASQRQRVHRSAEHQSEFDAAVAQAV